MKKIIKYVEKDGLLYPELKTVYQEKIILSKYGRMRKNFIKKYCPVLYQTLQYEGKLNDYLKKFNEEINFLHDKLIEEYSKEIKVDENLKQKNQLLWVQEMNNISSMVNEFLINEYIYVK